MRGIVPLGAALGGIAAGLLGGYLLFGEAPPGPQPPRIVAMPAAPPGASPQRTADSVAGTPTSTSRGVAPPAGTMLPATKPATDQAAACAPWIAESATLRTEVEALGARLAQVEQERRVAEGAEFAAPEDLGEDFRQVKLLENFQQALEHEELEGGVNAVDCSEYPCVVYGRLASREDIEQLLGSSALGMYRDAARDVSVWGFKRREDGEEAQAEYHFGVALFPREDDEQRGGELARRLNYRKQQMWEATRPR